jgi:hypothetical protein
MDLKGYGTITRMISLLMLIMLKVKNGEKPGSNF